MERVVWVAAFLLVMVGMPVATELQSKLAEDGSRLVITTRKGDQDIDVGYFEVKDETGHQKLCADSVSDEDCLPFQEPQITYQRQGVPHSCRTIKSSVNSSSATLRLCVYRLGSHIYGGPEQYNQSWPTEDNVYSDYPYVSKQEDNAGVAERYWLYSDGRYVYFPQYVPLFIEQNTNESGDDALCFISENKAPYPVDRPESVIEYTLCNYENARAAHEGAISAHFEKPVGIPDERMTTHPIWSTWARYKRDISDATVRQFASEILAHGFNNSQIEIDDKWETCYGSLAFDTTKFPDARALADDLHALGFRVTLWVHPFVNSDCEPYYSEALEKGWFVTDTDGSSSTSWWNGQGGIIDFNKGSAAGPWSCLLRKLQSETGIDSFKFDAGETSWLPQFPVMRPEETNPVQYSTDYVRRAAQFGSMVEVRVGQNTQQFPHYTRMIDKDSKWTFDNGLPTLVTTLLQMNIVGYPFVLPDMVGGNGYGSDVLTKELFIRWLQANVFMPAIQFSYVPWDFDEETVEISRQLTELHARYAPRIIELMRKAVEDGSPVNPPIWWIDPTDSTALAVSSEFLLGEDVLVAPVLEEGAVSRDIYLPRGSWRDEADPQHPVIDGPVWLTNYSAPLNVLPYFTRLSGDEGDSIVPATASRSATCSLLLYVCWFTFHHFLT